MDNKIEQITWLMNPFGLSLVTWFSLYAVKVVGLALLDIIVTVGIKVFKAPIMSFRRKFPNKKGLDKLAFLDYEYLIINSVIEFVFVNHVADFALHSGKIIWDIPQNGYVTWLIMQHCCVFLLFAIDDFFYALLHRALHFDILYGYIHKHHHRQTIPKRGYWDAGNEHPLEQIGGQGLLLFTLHIVSRIMPLHITTVVFHFILYAVLALMNHMPYDISFSFFGFTYEAHAHALHHRFPKCNMAQYFMWWDRFMGIYRDK